MEKKLTDGIRRRNEPEELREPPIVKKPRKKGDIVLRKSEKKKPSFIEKFAEHARYASEEGVILTEEVETQKEDKEFQSIRDALKPKHRPSIKNLKAMRLVFVGAGVISVAIIFTLLSTVFARLTVNLKLRLDQVSIQDILVVFDTSVSRPLLPQKVVPAEKLEFARSEADEFESTGRKYIEEKARGKVQLYNGFSSSPQTLVENTRFLTDTGILYRLTKTVLIPGAEIQEGKIVPKFIEVDLIADKAGDDSNNSASGITLKIPGFKGTSKYEGFYAVAESGFVGGFKGEALVVSKDDIKKAQEVMTKKVYDTLKQEVSRKSPPGFELLDSLREIQIVKIDAPRENARLDRFTVEAKAVARILIFRENDVREVLRGLILKDEKGKELVEGSFTVEYQIRNADFEKGRAEVVIRGEVKLKPVISEEEFGNLVRGKKEGTIIEALRNRPELATFSLNFFPPWLLKSPDDSSKIKFVIGLPEL